MAGIIRGVVVVVVATYIIRKIDETMAKRAK